MFDRVIDVSLGGYFFMPHPAYITYKYTCTMYDGESKSNETDPPKLLDAKLQFLNNIKC